MTSCTSASNCSRLNAEFEKRVAKLYQVKAFDDLNWFLGMKFVRDLKAGTINISMKQFVIDALDKYGLNGRPAAKLPCPTKHVFEEVNPETALDKQQQKLYMEKVGTLNYLATTLQSAQ